jgi:hypothetical protein
LRKEISVSKMSISRARLSGIFPASRSAQEEFETFILLLPPSQGAQNQKCSSPENKNPTFGLITEVGCLRCDLSIPYRASPPHSGALLQQRQMQAPTLILGHTGHFLSYSGTKESQFGEYCGLLRGVNPRLRRSEP